MNGLPDNRSIADLLRDLAGDVTRLVREEMALARSEASDKIHQMMTAIMAMAGGVVLALAALIILLQAVVIALQHVMPDWLAAVLVGGVAALVGLVMVNSGRKALSATQLAPQRTSENLRKDMNLVREHAS